MREAAQQTASDLDSLRQEMQKRMEALPEHTAQATAALRKALTEQLREIAAFTPAPPRAPPAQPGVQWSVGDLLTRASEPEPQGFGLRAAAPPAQQTGGQLRLDE